MALDKEHQLYHNLSDMPDARDIFYAVHVSSPGVGEHRGQGRRHKPQHSGALPAPDGVAGPAWRR